MISPSKDKGFLIASRYPSVNLSIHTSIQYYSYRYCQLCKPEFKLFVCKYRFLDQIRIQILLVWILMLCCKDCSPLLWIYVYIYCFIDLILFQILPIWMLLLCCKDSFQLFSIDVYIYCSVLFYPMVFRFMINWIYFYEFSIFSSVFPGIKLDYKLPASYR